jgi:hypothetical protein
VENAPHAGYHQATGGLVSPRDDTGHLADIVMKAYNLSGYDYLKMHNLWRFWVRQSPNLHPHADPDPHS